MTATGSLLSVQGLHAYYGKSHILRGSTSPSGAARS